MENNQSLSRTLTSVLMKVGIGLLVLLLLIVFNQVIQIVNFMSRIHPVLGSITLFILVVILASLFLLPLISFLRYKKMPELPSDEDGEEFEKYLIKVRAGLESNRYLRELGFRVNRDNPAKE